jgi:ribosomal protein S18 acetylase RimI-like enzyme
MTDANQIHEPDRQTILRYEVVPDDRCRVRDLVLSTGFFSSAEIDVAVELVDERLAKGGVSGYEFVLAEAGARLIGYACYGPIPATEGSYDLYWIVVDKRCQQQGYGRLLLETCEQQIRAAGGQRIFVDTSNRSQYAPTRAFYERCGYRREALLRDFYAFGDDKVIYGKAIGSGSTSGTVGAVSHRSINDCRLSRSVRV